MNRFLTPLLFLLLLLFPELGAQPTFQMEYINTVGTLQSRGVAEGPAGYFIGGLVQTSPGNLFDNFVMHTDVNGNPVWSYRYTDSVSSHQAMAICANTDSGCTFTGYVDTSSQVFWTATRLDKNGNIIWKNRYKYANENAYAKKIKQTSDGGFILAADYAIINTAVYAAVLKLDPNGNIQWSKRFLINTGSAASNNMEIIEALDGGYTLLSNSYQPATLTDSRLLHLDASGNFLWARSYGGSYADRPAGMVQLPNGNYVIAMRYAEPVNNIPYDGPMLVFTDSLGNELASKWHPVVNGPMLSGLNLIPNGNLILSGMMYGQPGPMYACGISTLYSPTGQMQVVKLYGDLDMEEIFATTIVNGGGQLMAGDVITGNPNTMLLIKTDSLLTVPCNTMDTLFAPMANNHITYTSQPDDTVALTTTPYTLQRVAFPQTVVNVCQLLSTGTEPETSGPALFPNPSGGIFTVRIPGGEQGGQLDVYDVFGRQIWSQAYRENEQAVNLAQVPAGLYILKITTPAGPYYRNIIIRN